MARSGLGNKRKLRCSKQRPGRGPEFRIQTCQGPSWRFANSRARASVLTKTPGAYGRVKAPAKRPRGLAGVTNRPLTALPNASRMPSRCIAIRLRLDQDKHKELQTVRPKETLASVSRIWIRVHAGILPVPFAYRVRMRGRALYQTGEDTSSTTPTYRTLRPEAIEGNIVPVGR